MTMIICCATLHTFAFTQSSNPVISPQYVIFPWLLMWPIVIRLHSVHSVNEILTEGKLQFFTLLIVTWQFNCEHDPFNLHGTFNVLFKHSGCRAFIRQDEPNTAFMTFLFHFWLDLVSANIILWLHLDLSFHEPTLLALTNGDQPQRLALNVWCLL